MPESFQIVAVVNVSGDSFSEGEASSPSDGVERAKKRLDEGADVVEFGAASSRPGAPEVSAETERKRLDGVLDRFVRERPGVPFAVDTYNADCAKTALEAGAVYVGDVSMLRHDPQMAATVGAFPGARLVLCHSRGTPETMGDPEYLDYGSDVVATVMQELDRAAEKAQKEGLPRERIVFDPGFGFAKTVPQQVELLRGIDRFTALGEVFAGVSRKSFLGVLSGEKEPSRRSAATLAAELFLAGKKVRFIRTHEPKPLRDAWRVYRELALC